MTVIVNNLLKCKIKISQVTNCQLESIGKLPFVFHNGACTILANDDVFLCFGDKMAANSTCHRSDDLDVFDEMPESLYDHTQIKIATSTSKL